jgi:hypothetical protein
VQAVIDEHRGADGAEPSEVMPIAPPTSSLHAQRKAQPDLLPQRAKRDGSLASEVERAWQENPAGLRVRQVWRQLRREGFEGALAL